MRHLQLEFHEGLEGTKQLESRQVDRVEESSRRKFTFAYLMEVNHGCIHQTTLVKRFVVKDLHQIFGIQMNLTQLLT